jgi:hypothetical protein
MKVKQFLPFLRLLLGTSSAAADTSRVAGLSVSIRLRACIGNTALKFKLGDL